MTVFGDQRRRVKKRNKRWVDRERHVFGVCTEASGKEGGKSLGSLSDDMVMEILPTGRSFFVGHC